MGAVGPEPDLVQMLGHQVTMFVVKTEKPNPSTGVINVYANPKWDTAKPYGATGDDDGWDA